MSPLSILLNKDAEKKKESKLFLYIWNYNWLSSFYLAIILRRTFKPCKNKFYVNLHNIKKYSFVEQPDILY